MKRKKKKCTETKYSNTLKSFIFIFVTRGRAGEGQGGDEYGPKRRKSSGRVYTAAAEKKKYKNPVV